MSDYGFLGEAPQEERTIYCHADEAACGEDHSQKSTSERERGQDERSIVKGELTLAFSTDSPLLAAFLSFSCCCCS